MKTCSVCKQDFDLTCFGVDSWRKDGYTSACRPCRLLQNKKNIIKRYDLNKEVKCSSCKKPIEKKAYLYRRYKCSACLSPLNRRDAYKFKYGITLDDYNQMLELQSYCCAICQKEKTLIVDHNHETNKIRQLLCQGCNKLITETVESDPNILISAYHYVNKHSGVYR